MGKPLAKRSSNRKSREGDANGFHSERKSGQQARSEARHETRDKSVIKPKTEAQADYQACIRNSLVTFGIGCAGTGKTFIAGCEAADALEDGRVDRIIATRPMVEAGRPLGAFPGTADDKFAPYFAPLLEVLELRLGRSNVEGMMKTGKILALPLELMRGRSFKNAFIILDEAQNTTPSQMKMFLSRTGEESIVVVDGDPAQSDLPGPNGLADAVSKLQGVPGITYVHFTRKDIVRSGIVRDIMERYEN